ncbi:hypothetical protein K492DRAFT_198574 [Lichtheimia hyalospora FSU 10163]|nr:hypothetical protein K492DRAFT_198574 [Lichtheimia hyalospora FSU 10163]
MQSHRDSCDNSSSPVIVAQHLDIEQKNYEFPSRALLLELSAHLDKDTYYEMFDESSFATTNTTTTITGSSVDRPSYDDIGSDDDEKLDSYIGSIVSSYQQQQQSRRIRRSLISYNDDHRERNNLSCFNYDHHHENDNDDPRVQRLIEDDRLSPLLLPARADPRRACQTFYDSTKISSTPTTQESMDLVGPSSFLKQHDKTQYQPPHKASRCYDSSHEELNLPNVSHIKQSRSPFLDDNDTDYTGDSKVIINIKLNSRGGGYRHMSWCQASDEGYNDDVDEEEELPMESVSVFLPLSPEELTDPEMLRNTAATRIQALWRGYSTRKQLFGNSHVSPAKRVVIDLARICMTLHRQQTMRLGERINMLEQEIAHERAMRIAFENAIEDMALTIDKQQSMVCERIEEMRESYQERIYQEQCARTDLEQSMAHVLEQVQDMQNMQQQRIKEDAEERAALHRKLDDALAEIDQLKQQQQPQHKKQSTLQRPSTSRRVNTPSLEQQRRRSIKPSSKPVRSSTHASTTTTTATRNTKSLNANSTTTNNTITTTTTTTTTTTATPPNTRTRRKVLSSSKTAHLSRVDTRR